MYIHTYITYTCVLRSEETFASSFELIRVICIKGDLYIVRRATAEYVCMYVFCQNPKALYRLSKGILKRAIKCMSEV